MKTYLASPTGINEINPFACQNGEAADDLLAESAEQLNDREVNELAYPRRQLQDVATEPFIWETDSGELIRARDMTTPHLFYTLRMLFNHSVPPAFRVGKFLLHAGVFKWPVEYRIQASNAMQEQLDTRKDVLSWMRHELNDIALNVEFLDKVYGRVADEQTITLAPDQITDLKKIRPAKRRSVKRKAAKGKVSGYRQMRGGKLVWIRGYKR